MWEIERDRDTTSWQKKKKNQVFEVIVVVVVVGKLLLFLRRSTIFWDVGDLFILLSGSGPEPNLNFPFFSCFFY